MQGATRHTRSLLLRKQLPELLRNSLSDAEVVFAPERVEVVLSVEFTSAATQVVNVYDSSDVLPGG
jgi:hypothetical protein